MPVVKPDHELQGDQRAFPLVWHVEPHPDFPDAWLPDTSDEVLELAFGEGASRKLKSWGHDPDLLNAHWLVTRGGTPLHTDPAYARYTHHLILRNDGFRLIGLDDQLVPPLRVGRMYCLDAHSPHQVVPDKRLLFLGGKPVYKVQIAVDTNEPLTPEQAWEAFRPMLHRDLREGAADAAKTAPAPKVKATR